MDSQYYHAIGGTVMSQILLILSHYYNIIISILMSQITMLFETQKSCALLNEPDFFNS